MRVTKSAFQAVLPRLARLVLLAFACAVAATLVVLVVIPRATHGSALTVLTGSMTPEIPVGSVVVVRPVDPGTLRVGDIATYQVAPDKPEFITHRIVKIDNSTSPASFTFKGDANRGADIKPVPAGAIRGKVWFHVPYIGAIRDALHGKGGITLVAMLAMAGYALSQLSGAFQDRKQARSDTTAQDGSQARLSAVELGRPVLLTVLSVQALARVEGLTPADAARQWGGLLLAHDEHECTVLIAPPVEGLVAAEELLATFDPVSLRRFSSPALVDAIGMPPHHQHADTPAEEEAHLANS